MTKSGWIRILPTLLFITLAACAPRVDPAGPAIRPPLLEADGFIMPDGAVLPYQEWGPVDQPPQAILLALHGFNDYANAYDQPARYWAGRGIRTYAYDQRGFGRAPNRGIWAGSESMRADVRHATRLLRRRYPGLPLFLIGESMGAAVALTAMTGDNPPDVNGTILSAPAVWGKQTLPFYKLAPIWLFAHTLPWLEVRPQLRLKPSDNIEMLRALGRDPLIIKRTRIDAAWGLLNLMTEAHAAGTEIRRPTLILYGKHEELIPGDARSMFIEKLPDPDAAPWELIEYNGGYHMLMRDLEADRVWRDIADYILAPTSAGRIAQPAASAGESG